MAPAARKRWRRRLPRRDHDPGSPFYPPSADAGLVGPCEAAPLAENLERLLADPDLGAEMGRRGKALVARRFQWDGIALALQDLYARLIANRLKKG